MERFNSAVNASKRVSQSDVSTSSVSPSSSIASTAAPTTFDRDAQRPRPCVTEGTRQFIAWILAITSFLYLLSFTNFFVWLSTSASAPRQPSEAVLSSDFSRLNVATSFRGTHLRGVFTGPSPPGELEAEKRIPRIVHQTYKSKDLPEEVRHLITTWKNQNPGWEYYFYNDTDCNRFVEREFPEYSSAYDVLAKNVERSDFFRYMVILRYGGVYADVDTECVVPMDDLIQSEDSMVVGWECDTPNVEEAEQRNFVRRRQVLQWVFAAEPGHPALKNVCEYIAANAWNRVSNGSINRETLEKTGPGAWTDAVLGYFKERSLDNRIRFLPQVAFGTHPSATDSIPQDSPGVMVRHHFLGSWKTGDWTSIKTELLGSLFGKKPVDRIRPAAVPYFPVAADFSPSFSIMVNPSGVGEPIGGVDVASMITRWGLWQAGDVTPGRPRVVDVVAGALGDGHMDLWLLDLGAGVGFFSLAAAARGHPVLAFETESASIPPLKKSITANNFTEKLMLLTTPRDLMREMQTSCAGDSDDLSSTVQRRYLEYSDPSDAADNIQHTCSPEIGALRIGYSGWSAWLNLRNARPFKDIQPPIIIVEYSPWKMKESGWKDPTSFLNEMVDRGYTEAYHTGNLCQRRWDALSRHAPFYDSHEKPVWCNVSPEDFVIFERIDDRETAAPENLLFLKRGM